MNKDIEISILGKFKQSFTQYKKLLTLEELHYLNIEFAFVEPLKEKIRCIEFNVRSLPNCKLCGNILPNKNLITGRGKLREYCSRLCAVNNPDTRKKIVQSYKKIDRGEVISKRNKQEYVDMLTVKYDGEHSLEIESEILDIIVASPTQYRHKFSDTHMGYLNKFFGFCKSISDMAYCLKNDIREIPKCKMCDANITKFRNVYCSRKCQYSDEEIKQKISASVCVSHDSESDQGRVYSGRRWRLYSNNGVEFLYQGYEGRGYDFLLKIGYNTIDIIPHPKGYFEYVNENGRTRKYKPDFYIPKDNLYVEVKSSFTYTDKLEQNLQKRKAVEDNGHNFKFLIIGKDTIYE